MADRLDPWTAFHQNGPTANHNYYKTISLVYTGLLMLWLVSPSRTEFTFVHMQLHCRKKAVFSMAIGNEELMHECFPKHSRLKKARMKYDKVTEEEG